MEQHAQIAARLRAEFPTEFLAGRPDLTQLLIDASTALESLQTAGETLADFACTAPGRLPERVTTAVVAFKGEHARRTPQTG